MQANKRGEQVALGGLGLQLVLAALMAGIWWFTGSAATWGALWLTVAPLPAWLLTAVLFYCRFLQRREEQEERQLAARGAEGLFQEGRPVRPAANRVRWMERYLVAAFTLLWAGYHLALGLLLLGWLSSGAAATRSANASSAFFFALGGAFVAFLFSRYATGMAKVETWRLLRAPGSYLFANAVTFLLLATVFAAEYLHSDLARKVVAHLLPLFMLLIGAELVLNFILDLYRPRVPGGEPRFSYDSRLLNLIASPESIGRSLAEALNYQFGFEVSSSWFYQLLQRAFVPLILAGVAVMWLMTAVVVVEEGECYVRLHWGKAQPGRLLTPRPWPHLVWPWPIDSVRRFQTGKVHQVLLGVGGPRKEETLAGKRIYLWGYEHGPRNELDTLVAIPPPEGKRRHEDVPSVSIIKLVVAVLYRITDPYKFGYTTTDPVKLLEDAAYREMVRYAASATLDEPLPTATGPARPAGIMSFGRQQAAEELKVRIAAAAAAYDLGVQIVDVQLLACHPPKEAAPAFEAVIAAEREQDRVRYAAQAYANRILAEVAGYPDEALRLAQVIQQLQELETLIALGREGGDVAGRARQGLVQAAAEATKLRKEIEAERLLGRSAADRPGVTADLLERQDAFVALLKEIQADPRRFDLDGPLQQAQREAEDLFAGVPGKSPGVQGRAAVLVDQARSYRWRTEFAERARAETFGVELTALRAAPSLYRLDKYLEVLSTALQPRRKYVFGLDRNRVEVWLNLEQPPQSFGDITFGKEQ